MADKQVVRQDVVQITWDVQDSPISKITGEAKKLQTSISKTVGTSEDKFNGLTKSVKKTQKQLSQMKLSDRVQADIDLADKALDKLRNTAKAAAADLAKLKTQAALLSKQSFAKVVGGVNAVKTAVQNVVPNTIAFVASLKDAAKQKLTSTINDIRKTKQILTEGKTGAQGFATAIKNVGKIGLAKTIRGVTNIKNGFTTAKNTAKTFATSLKTGVVNGFTRAVAGAKKFVTSIKAVNREKLNQLMTGVNNLTKKLGAGLVTAAKKAAKAIATIGIGTAVGAFKLTDMASNLSETLNKVDVSFGKNSGSVKEWSKNSIKDMGLAQQTALDMAALFGDMGTGMGIPQKEAANMSMKLTQLGADLASFKNMDIEEVTTALNGVFTGETESLKRLGVVMTQANLEAFALSKGLKKPIDEMSESEKVMLRYEYVLSKTKNAQGDFARTGGGFANQLRMAKEQLKQIGTTIGGVFIGGFEKALQKVNTFGTELNAKLTEVFSDGFQFGDIAKITPMLGPLGTAIQKVADKIRSITSNKEKMAQIKGVFEALKGAAGKVAEFVGKAAGKVTDFVTSTGFLKTVKTVINGVNKAFGFLNKHLDTILEVVIPLAAGIAGMVGTIKLISAAMKVWSAVQWVLNSGLLACPITWVVVGIGALIAIIVVLVRHWDKVKETATKCWDKIKSVWGKVKDWFNAKVIQPVKKFFAEMWDKLPAPVKNVIKKIKDGFQEAFDKVTKVWGGFKDFLAGVWKDAVKAVAKPVNKLIDGANWVLEKVGSDKELAHWEPYARGTNGHPGGNAIVNDGRGAELVQMPNGRTFIPKGRNVGIPNAPKGMKVLDAQRTAQLMGRSSPTFNYEGGIGDWAIWDFFDNAKGLVSKVIEKFISWKDMGGYALDVGKALVTKATGAMAGWVKGLFSEFGGKSLADYAPSKGVEQWRSTVVQALKMEGQHSAANVKRTLHQMQTESGGNPKAINNWDVNARRGTPSKGLMQVIDPTFKAYARKGYASNIYDPLSNILASVRYAVSRYGTLEKAYRGVGYEEGIGFPRNMRVMAPAKKGVDREEGVSFLRSMLPPRKSEGYEEGVGFPRIMLPAYTPASTVPASSSTSTQNNSYAPSFTLNMSGTVDKTTERTVKRWVKEAMEDMFDSMERTNPRLTEV